MSDNIIKLKSEFNLPTPKKVSYPADYSLAIAAYDLNTQWGKNGAINRMIEMVEWLKEGKDPFLFNQGSDFIGPKL